MASENEVIPLETPTDEPEQIVETDVDEQLTGFGGSSDEEVKEEESNEGDSDEELQEQETRNDGEGDEAGSEDAEEVPEKEEVKPDPAPPIAGASKEFRAKVSQIALKRFQEENGVEYDVFDPEHQAQLFALTSEVMADVKDRARQLAKEESERAKVQESINELFPTPDALKFADEAYLNLPVREAQRIEKAIERGDSGPYLEFCKKTASAFGLKPKVEKKISEIKSRKAPPPPVLEGSGGRGEAGGASDDSMDQLAGFGLA